jgi:hypothetical protein
MRLNRLLKDLSVEFRDCLVEACKVGGGTPNAGIAVRGRTPGETDDGPRASCETSAAIPDSAVQFVGAGTMSDEQRRRLIERGLLTNEPRVTGGNPFAQTSADDWQLLAQSQLSVGVAIARKVQHQFGVALGFGLRNGAFLVRSAMRLSSDDLGQLTAAQNGSWLTLAT